MQSKGEELKALINAPEVVITPGVYDGFTARLIERAGFKTATISGAGTSESRLGWADRETARTLMNGRSAIPQTLVIAPDGRIVSHWNGYTRGRSGDHLRETIERAFSEASAGAKVQ